MGSPLRRERLLLSLVQTETALSQFVELKAFWPSALTPGSDRRVPVMAWAWINPPPVARFPRLTCQVGKLRLERVG